MKRSHKILVALLFILFCLPAFSTNTLRLNTHSSGYPVKQRLALMNEFKAMYRHKHFSSYLFDLKNGYVQMGDSENKMPLNYFVRYNNMWWFSIIDKVVVPAIGYDPKTQTGFIVLNIYYDNNHVHRGMQYVKFSGSKINYIRSYASSTFFTSNQNDPLVRLDTYGNQIWHTTGNNLTYSVKASLLFLQSPVGKLFMNNPKTSKAIKKIKSNLTNYLKKHAN